MRKIAIIILLFCGSLFAQELPQIWFYTYPTNSAWTVSFPGYDTLRASSEKSLPTPFSGSWLYGNGATRGYFMRCLAPMNVDASILTPQYTQKFMKMITASGYDSVTVWDTSYQNGTGKYFYGTLNGSNGWIVRNGFNFGPHIREAYVQGTSLGSMAWKDLTGDTSWHSYIMRIRNWAGAGEDTVRLYTDGTLNTTTVGTLAVGLDTSFAMTWFNINAPRSVSDTTQQPGSTTQYHKGGLRYWRYSVYYHSGETVIDTTAIMMFPGYGQTVYMNIYVNGVLISGWENIERPNYTGSVPYSYHLFRGISETDDRHDPVWVNTSGTVPSYITRLGTTGLWAWDSSANCNLQRESYTNGEDIFWNATRDTSWLIVSGPSNNFEGASDVLGTVSMKMAAFNLVTNTWEVLPGLVPAGGHPTTLCQRGDTLILGGQFTSVSGVANTNRLAGYIWSTKTVVSIGTCNADVGFVGMIGNNLFIGGGFTTVGGVSAVRVAMNDGTGWKAYGTGMNNSVNSVIVYNSDTLFGGSFATANGVTVNGLAKWTGSTFTGYGLGMKNNSGGIGSIFSMIVFNDNLRIGGQFDSLNSVECQNYIQYDGSVFLNIGGCRRGANYTDVAVIDQYIDPVRNVLGIVGQFSSWNGHIASCMIMDNGREFMLCPAIDMRPEGIRITNDGRWLIVGDMFGVFGKNVYNAYELTPVWSFQ